MHNDAAAQRRQRPMTFDEQEIQEILVFWLHAYLFRAVSERKRAFEWLRLRFAASGTTNFIVLSYMHVQSINAI